MQRHMKTLGAIAAVAGVSFCCWFFFWSPRPVKRVEYKNYTGTTARVLPISNATSAANLTDVTPTPFPTVTSRELLSFEGPRPKIVDGEAPMVSVEFAQRSPDGKEVIAQTGLMMIEDAGTHAQLYQLKVNAPMEPGKYTVRLKWGFTHYLAVGDIVVARK